MAKRIKVYRVPISGGKFKGKIVEIPAISTTRSSKSILKESYFNTLQFDIVGKNFVEVFAGSGSIALEAISRGAKRAWCIEKNYQAFNILKKNIDSIAPKQITPIFGDSFEEFKYIVDELRALNERAYFYFDPPFSIRESMEDIYEKSIDLIKMLDRDVCILATIEHMSSLELPKKIGKLELIKNRRFGKSSLSYYEAK